MTAKEFIEQHSTPMTKRDCMIAVELARLEGCIYIAEKLEAKGLTDWCNKELTEIKQRNNIA